MVCHIQVVKVKSVVVAGNIIKHFFLFSYAVGESYYARLHDKKPSGLFRESRNVLYFH